MQLISSRQTNTRTASDQALQYINTKTTLQFHVNVFLTHRVVDSFISCQSCVCKPHLARSWSWWPPYCSVCLPSHLRRLFACRSVQSRNAFVPSGWGTGGFCVQHIRNILSHSRRSPLLLPMTSGLSVISIVQSCGKYAYHNPFHSATLHFPQRVRSPVPKDSQNKQQLLRS